MTPKGAPTLTPLGEHEGRSDLPLSRAVSLIGSRDGSRIHLTSSTVSKAHALVVNQNTGPYIRDLLSRTHTLLNGQAIGESDLSDGDELVVGRFRFRFNAGLPPVRDGSDLDAAAKHYDTPPPAVLRVSGEDLPVPIADRSLVIGRRKGCDARLEEESVSTVHAVVFEFNGRHVVRDVGSRTGTKVNGHPIRQVELSPGDELAIGQTTLRYELAEPAGEEAEEVAAAAAAAIAAPEPDGGLDEMDRQLGLAADASASEAEHPDAAGAGQGVSGVAAIDQELEIRGFEAEPEHEKLSEGELDRVALEGESGRPDDTLHLPALGDKPSIKPVMRLKHEPERVEEVRVRPAASLEDTVEDEKMQSRGGWRAIPASAEGPAQPPATQASEPAEPSEPQAEAEQAEVEQAEAAEAEQIQPEPAEPMAFDEPSRPPPIALASALRDDAPAPPMDLADVAESADEAKADLVDAEPPMNLAGSASESADAPAEPAEPQPAPRAELHLAHGELVDDHEDTATHEVFEHEPLSGDPLTLHDPDADAAAAVEPAGRVPAEPLDLGEPAIESLDEKPEPLPLDLPEEAEATNRAGDERAAEAGESADTAGRGKPKRARRSRRKRGGRDKSAELRTPPIPPPLPPLPASVPGMPPAPIVDVEVMPIEEPPVLHLQEPPPLDTPAPDAPVAAGPIVMDVEPEPLPAETPQAAQDAEAMSVVDQAADDEASTPQVDLDVADALEIAEPPIGGESPDAQTDDADAPLEEQIERFIGASTGPLIEDTDAAQVAPDETIESQASDEVALDDAVADDAIASAAVADDAVADAAPIDLESPEPLPPLVLDDQTEPASVDAPIAEAPAVEPIEERDDGAEADRVPQPVARGADKAGASTDPRSGWGANQDHFLGGVPLPLPPAPAVAHSAAAPFTASGLPKKMRIMFDPDSAPPAAAPQEPAAPPRKVRTTGFEGLSLTPFAATATPPRATGPVTPTQAKSAQAPPASPPIPSPVPTPEPSAMSAPPVAEPPIAEPRLDAEEPADRATRSSGDTDAPLASLAPSEWVQAESSSDTLADAPVRAAIEARPHAAPSIPDALVADPDASVDPDEPPIAVVARPRRRKLTVPVLVVLMLILAAAAAAAIYLLVPLSGRIDAALPFVGGQSLTQAQRVELRQEQRNLLTSAAVRQAALGTWSASALGQSPGLLSDQAAIARLATSADWRPGDAGAPLELAIAQKDHIDPDGADPQRLHALLTALHDANAHRLARGEQLRGDVEAARAAHQRAQQQLADVKGQIERMQTAAMNRLDPSQRAAAQQDMTRIEAELGDAVMAVKTLQAELEQLRGGMPVELQPTGAGVVPVVDPRLTELDNDLSRLNQRMAAVRVSRAVALEESVEQVKSAAEAVRVQADRVQAAPGREEDGELSAYLDAVSNLGVQAPKQVEQFITKRAEQQAALIATRQRLEAQLEAQRTRQWEQDPQLRQYAEQLQATTRQHDQAVRGGMFAEAQDLKAAMDLLQQMIEARQTLIADDADLAAAIDELEKRADEQQKQMEADRAAAEKQIDVLAHALHNSQRAAQSRLSNEQKEQAAAMVDRLAVFSQALRAYGAAADAAQAEDPELAAMEQNAQQITEQIDQRRGALAEETRKAASAEQEQARQQRIGQREDELAKAQARETEARRAWSEAFKRSQESDAALATARDAGEQQDQLSTRRDELEKRVADEAQRLQAATEALAAHVEPVRPVLNTHVRAAALSDRRPALAGASAGVVVLIFAGLIVASARPPAMRVGRPVPRPMPRATTEPAEET